MSDNANGNGAFEHVADVSAQRIARVYAEALLNAAEQKNDVDNVAEQLESLVQDLFRADLQFEEFLASGAISRQDKERVLRDVLGPRAGETFLNFLLVVNRHERLGLVRPILLAFRALRDERARRIRVQVRSAVPLPDDQRQRLQQELHDSFRLEPVLETAVDPELLGGLVVRVGDWVYDGSVRNQLHNIRNQIIERSSYEIQSGRNRFRAPD
jgi:F-type H+-transporting ATPase subunit delta